MDSISTLNVPCNCLGEVRTPDPKCPNSVTRGFRLEVLFHIHISNPDDQPNMTLCKDNKFQRAGLEMKKTKYKVVWKQIGSVWVDSGQLFITDPCYLDEWIHGDCVGKGRIRNSYDMVCKTDFATCIMV